MSKKRYKIIPTKEELEDLYLKEGATISSVARQYGASNPTVRSWLNKHGVSLKTHKQASRESNRLNRRKPKPDKKDLERLYSENTIKELEKLYSVGQQTIYEWLKEYGIEIKTLSSAVKQGKEKQYRSIQFKKEFLDVNYERDKSLSVLADKLGVSRSHIRQQLISNDIKIEPIASPTRSAAEIELYEFLLSKFPYDNWEANNRTLIKPLELDIVNSDKKIAIEYCGLYWHSEFSSGKDSRYHRNKYELCKELGFKLITIFESDDMDKVKKLLLKLLGQTTKVYARKTSIIQLDSRTAKKFHDEHHLHGSIGASHHYGLYHNGELLMVGSFGKNRFSKKYEYECTRLTSHGSTTIVGGVSKIFKHFIKNVNPKSIVTFADLRFGDGKSYLNCGFEEVEESAQNYWYFKKNTNCVFSRVKFQKHKLKDLLEVFDSDLTEFENMINNNWDRIWDCGNAKYIWINPSPPKKHTIENFFA